MAYRNGTYIAFHAGGTTDPTSSDIKYYHMMCAWHANDDIEFKFINSHEKTNAVRDSSLRATLQARLRERLNNSKNMVLIVGSTTRFDTDWVPFEIVHAIDKCGIPIIAAYPGYEWITAPSELAFLWPKALADRIGSGSAWVMHVPFQRRAIDTAIRQYDLSNLPPHGLWFWSRNAHKEFGITIK
jgi:hypothetical protein